MMYLNEDSGRAIGALVSAAGVDAEIEITIDSVIIRLRSEAHREESKNDVSKKQKPKKNTKLTKTEKKRKWREGEKLTFNGESLTRREWAAKLGITESGVSYRIQAHGNPFGAKSPKPTDGDKVVAGSR